MKPIIRKLVPVLLLACLSGCAALAKFLPDIVSFLGKAQEASQQVGAYEAIARAALPDQTAQRVLDVVDRARAAIAAADRAAAGAEAWSRDDEQAALADFRAAWAELELVSAPLFAPPDPKLLKISLRLPPERPRRPLAAE